jgi:very-short-patch-repair endonuclease
MLEDNESLRRFARQMRREATPAELTLWKLVRNRRLIGFKFRRQHPFGRYILDCYCPTARLAIELDGDSHATLGGQQADAERGKYLNIRGIIVLRFWNTEVAEDPDGVLNRIVETCVARVMTEGKKQSEERIAIEADEA